MRTRRYFLLFIILLFGVLSCRDVRLSDIESYIDDRPDSALAAIRAIDTTALRGRAVKAKYSLLHAMALDKNYIDTADTRIVQPAVDWYSRHGSPEEKLKAYYYQGREYHNNKQYDQAAVSYAIALESIDESNDFNLNGMLYSAMADALTFTLDFAEASSYFDKAISSFRKSGRKDWENLELFRKAQNHVNTKDWDSALALFQTLLEDDSISVGLRARIEGDYAMALVVGPKKDMERATGLFKDAMMDNGGRLMNINQVGAYAYSLFLTGQRKESESTMAYLESIAGEHNLYYLFWRHGIQQAQGDYKNAYLSLLESKEQSDSINTLLYVKSAANAQRTYLENRTLESRINDGRRKRISVYLSLAVLSFLFMLYRGFKRKRKELERECDRMVEIKETLESRLSDMTMEKHKAKFTYLSELYKVYQLVDKNESEMSIHKSYLALKRIVSDLENDEASQVRFEALVNHETDNLMKHFREEFQGLSLQEYRLTSFVFAGFDNTILSYLLMLSPSNTRTTKSRMKAKIECSKAAHKEEFLKYFSH